MLRQLISYPKIFFRSLDLRSQISKWIMWIISKSHREKKFFFDIFAIHSSTRHEKRCQMRLRLFSLFRGSIYQQWITHTFIYTQNDSNFNLKILSIYFEGTTLAIFEDCITFRHKMQSFPCSILTFGYQSCFLGPPKVEIQ